jgi:RNA polymerase sigma-70 factor (ECF subfamily)
VNPTNTGYNEADHHLVRRVLNGDNAAFAAIVKNTEVLVTQIIFKMVSNPVDRKDLAQDIYLKVYKNLRGFKFQSKLSTWIAQVAYNTCFDHLRKKKVLLPDNFEEEHEHNAGSSDEVILSMQQKELSVILKSAIEKLSPIYQTLITLYHQQEMSYLEITEITGLPEGTVKSYLFRARKTLKETLALKYQKEEI